MGDKKVFRVILLLAAIGAAFASQDAEFEGRRVGMFITFTLMFVAGGYVLYFVLRILNWIAFRGSDGDGLQLVPTVGKIVYFPIRPFVALARFAIRRNREAAVRNRAERERPERERRALVAANAESERLKAEREEAYWASPAGQEVRAAQALADIELKKSVALANLAIKEQDAAIETARLLRQEEEERERRRVELIKSI
ncbi:MAG: hypothetical protein Q7R40_06405 [Phaeospirillum sp.]|nr:hypothetical protein [Phaeospirillum sp.]